MAPAHIKECCEKLGYTSPRGYPRYWVKLKNKTSRHLADWTMRESLLSTTNPFPQGPKDNRVVKCVREFFRSSENRRLFSASEEATHNKWLIWQDAAENKEIKDLLGQLLCLQAAQGSQKANYHSHDIVDDDQEDEDITDDVPHTQEAHEGIQGNHTYTKPSRAKRPLHISGSQVEEMDDDSPQHYKRTVPYMGIYSGTQENTVESRSKVITLDANPREEDSRHNIQHSAFDRTANEAAAPQFQDTVPRNSSSKEEEIGWQDPFEKSILHNTLPQYAHEDEHIETWLPTNQCDSRSISSSADFHDNLSSTSSAVVEVRNSEGNFFGFQQPQRTTEIPYPPVTQTQDNTEAMPYGNHNDRSIVVEQPLQSPIHETSVVDRPLLRMPVVASGDTQALSTATKVSTMEQEADTSSENTTNPPPFTSLGSAGDTPTTIHRAVPESAIIQPSSSEPNSLPPQAKLRAQAPARLETTIKFLVDRSEGTPNKQMPISLPVIEAATLSDLFSLVIKRRDQPISRQDIVRLTFSEMWDTTQMYTLHRDYTERDWDDIKLTMLQDIKFRKRFKEQDNKFEHLEVFVMVKL